MLQQHSQSTFVRHLRIAGQEPSGFTLIELLVSIGVVAILVSLLGPAIQTSRERSRLISCRNNLKQLVLAAHSYESSHKTFPYTSAAWIDPGSVRHPPISPHASMMAFLDPTVSKSLDFSSATDVSIWAVRPTFQTVNHQRLSQMKMPVMSCPSDEQRPGATNYRANLGISVNILPASNTVESISQQGAFVNGRSVVTAEFRDGLSQTALFSERVLGNADQAVYDPFRNSFSEASGSPTIETPMCLAYCQSNATQTPTFQHSFCGGTWLWGGFLNTWYLHVVPPNSRVPDCSPYGPGSVDGGPGLVTARSFHVNGVNMAMADSAVRFMSQSVSASVFSAIGTRRLAEVVQQDP